MKAIIKEIAIQVLNGEIKRKDIRTLYGNKISREVATVLDSKLIEIKKSS